MAKKEEKNLIVDEGNSKKKKRIGRCLSFGIFDCHISRYFAALL